MPNVCYMIKFRRAVFDLTIPFNVLAVLWVGRGLFGATLAGIALLMLVFIVPVLVVALIASTALAFSQPPKTGAAFLRPDSRPSNFLADHADTRCCDRRCG